MHITKTQEAVFFRFIWDYATDLEKTQIQIELGVPVTVNNPPEETEPAHPNYSRPNSERPDRPFDSIMDITRAILNHAIKNDLPIKVIATILNDHTLWHWEEKNVGKGTLTTTARGGYNFSIELWKWNPCFSEEKCLVITKILQRYFPDWEYNSDWKPAE